MLAQSVLLMRRLLTVIVIITLEINWACLRLPKMTEYILSTIIRLSLILNCVDFSVTNPFIPNSLEHLQIVPIFTTLFRVSGSSPLLLECSHSLRHLIPFNDFSSQHLLFLLLNSFHKV
jgi:hypothetical protein